MKRDFDVKFTSVKRKDAKVNNEVVSRYVVSFDVTVEAMDYAFEIARGIEDNLGNNLEGQTTLNPGDKPVKRKKEDRARVTLDKAMKK